MSAIGKNSPNYQFFLYLHLLLIQGLLLACSLYAASAAIAEVKLDCSKTKREDLPNPSIDIHSVSPHGRAVTYKIKVKGSIEGVCLNEAGLYEDGKLVRKIQMQTSTQFKRKDFEIISDLKKNSELRVYTIHGDRTTAQIKPNVKVATPTMDGLDNDNVEIIIVPPIISYEIPVRDLETKRPIAVPYIKLK